MREKLPAQIAYLVLVLGGLCIPMAHHSWAEQVIESTRMAGGLLPVPFQIFRRIGMLIWLLPVPAFVGFLMSLRFVLFRSFQGVCIVAISMFVCASLYAAYCSFLLYFVLGVRAA